MKKIIRNIVLLLAVICAIIGVVLFWQERNAGSEYESLREEVKVQAETEFVTEAETENLSETRTVSEKESESEPVTETEFLTETETETEREPIEIPVDFEALQKKNPDIYAWLIVEGTEVDYPIVQSPDDNTYYLDHSAEKKEAVEGAIFTEDYNALDFEDPNTVIYGHNMKNESMFGSLHRFMDRSFFNENRKVTVYLPDEIRHYEIFAAYLYDSRHILQTYDFSNDVIFKYYLDQIFSMRDMNSFVDSSYDLDKDDRIITLSTCYKGLADTRYLVQAVLTDVEK